MSERDEALAPWDDPSELPESWQPKNGGAGDPARVASVTSDELTSAPDDLPLGGNIPDIDLKDPAQLETFYGNFAFFDHYRKAVLSQCHELLRAKYINKEKVTEQRLENESRTHPIYLSFLTEHFHGRHQRERNVWESLRRGS
jgi:hypothetical protein